MAPAPGGTSETETYAVGYIDAVIWGPETCTIQCLLGGSNKNKLIAVVQGTPSRP